MATIALYSSKLKQMTSLLTDVKKSVTNYNEDLFDIKSKAMKVDKKVCNMDDIISSLQSSTQTQEDKIDALDTYSKDIEQFEDDVVHIDDKVAEQVNKKKDDFYSEYYYLKPECEKSGLEQLGDTLKKAGEWCKEHWKLVVTIVLVVAAVAAIVLTAGAALGPISLLVVTIAKGILVGAAVGGLLGGITNAAFGGSFFEGFEDGAFGGAISGAISGGMGFGMSAFGEAARELGAAGLSTGQLMLIGATSETVTTLLGDVGDIFIKGDNLSLGDVMFDAAFSVVLGGGFAGLGEIVGAHVPKLKINGINKGTGSWAHVWHTQLTRSLRHGSKVSLKTLLKGIGSTTVDSAWDNVVELVKNITSQTKDKLVPNFG